MTEIDDAAQAVFQSGGGDTNRFQPGDRRLFKQYLTCLVKLRRAYEKSRY